MNNPVAASNSESTTSCHREPVWSLATYTKIVGNLKTAKIGAISRVRLSGPD